MAYNALHGQTSNLLIEFNNSSVGKGSMLCFICDSEFKCFNRERCCSIKCKLLDGKEINDNGCWIYKKSASGSYGKVRWRCKWYSAHRSSYEVFVGSIPKEKWVCHKCDSPKCINPDHLFLGSPSENRRDAVAKKRIPMGENNHFSRFTDDQVTEIRKLKEEGFTYDRISKIFNCSFPYINKILSNKLRKLQNAI
jgi:hypothetical protein